jgi:hypothetical protein
MGAATGAGPAAGFGGSVAGISSIRIPKLLIPNVLVSKGQAKALRP